ncbi:MAG: response regulator [Pseudobacteriovorax sp.]|nr:response regulator [Pseudobacteriovorax sp.]
MDINNKEINIVSVSSSGTRRQLINTAVRSHGFSEVNGVPDLKTVLEIFETGKIDWIICPLCLDEEINAFQILKLITDNYYQLNARVTLLINEDELEHVGTAFNLGALSYHVGLEAKDSVDKAFSELFETTERYQSKMDLVAAFYIRRLLRETNHVSELIRFEKRLLKMNPGQADLLCSLGESYYLKKEVEKAYSLWQQAEVVDPGNTDRVKESQANVGFNDADLEQMDEIEKTNILGIERCLVVDEDQGDLNAITGFLEDLAVPDVRTFTNPEGLLEFLKSKLRVDLIIFEWTFKTMPGPILVQRLRDVVGTGIPLTVISKDLTADDLPLLREMGVTDRIGKPLEKAGFTKEVIWIINQDRHPTEPFMIFQKLLTAIKDKNKEDMLLLKEKYLHSSAVTPAQKLYVESLIAYHSGCYLAAKDYAIQTLKSGGESLDALNLLGKSMMKLREFDAALRCLENAQVISPQNIERICRIAEAHLENGNDDKFDKSLSSAEALDGENQKIVEKKAKSALKHHNFDETKSLMARLENLDEIVSYTNNRAVSLIRTQSFDSGINLYKDAHEAVPEEKPVIRGILAYNLALAYIRTDEPNLAYETLKQVKLDEKTPLAAKIKSLKVRLGKSIKMEQPFQLQPPKIETLADEQSKLEELKKKGAEILKSLKVRPGDICCHKIFMEDKKTETVMKALATKLDVKIRTPKERKKSA